MELHFVILLTAIQVWETTARMLYDNLVMEEPQIMCMNKQLGVSVQTRDPFFGRIFVNGMSNMPNCHRQFNSRYNAGQFMLDLGSCDMRMQRVLYPRPGIEYSTMMVVSFHTDLLTEKDKIFHVKCRYHETHRSMGSFFEVSMLPTQILTSSFPMPNCKYTLHVGSVNGPQADFAKIGEPVYHRWECDSDMYGIKVKSCFVDDGRKRRYMLIDASGCAADMVILPDITYDNSLRSAFVQTHVFKFADKAHVFFQCQITLCLKERGACIGVTPPNCAQLRKKRAAQVSGGDGREVEEEEEEEEEGEEEEMDLSSHSLVVLDLGDEQKFEAYVERTQTQTAGFCLPTYGFAALISTNLVTLIVATIATLVLCRRPNPVSFDKS